MLTHDEVDDMLVLLCRFSACVAETKIAKAFGEVAAVIVDAAKEPDGAPYVDMARRFVHGLLERNAAEMEALAEDAEKLVT